MTSSNAFEDLREGLMEFVISPQVISPLSTDTQLAIKAEVDEFGSAGKSIVQSGEQSEGSFREPINELCEQLISQCKLLRNYFRGYDCWICLELMTRQAPNHPQGDFKA